MRDEVIANRDKINEEVDPWAKITFAGECKHPPILLLRHSTQIYMYSEGKIFLLATCLADARFRVSEFSQH